MLFELCPTSQRCVSHKGPQKDVNNIKSCLKVLNECGENTPSLLGRMEQLYAELCSIKHAVQVQADVSEDFRTITVDINRRGCALERSSDLTRGHGLGASAEMVGDTGEGAMAGTTGLDGMDNTALEAASVAAGAPGLDAEELGGALRSGCGVGCDSEESWWVNVFAKLPKVESCCEKTHRLAQVLGNAAAQTRSRTVIPRLKRKVGNGSSVGTGAVGNIKMVKTKLVSVFATKFSPDLDAETLSAYLREKLGHDVSCQKIDTIHRRFGSFKVSAECNELGEMYNPELWPEGAFVRRYYEPRRAGAIESNTALAAGEMSVPAGALPAH